jgi:hypothetical protein
MASQGQLTINDGILSDSSATSSMSTSFSVVLTCSQNVLSLDGTYADRVSFSKTFNRVAPSRNPIKRAKALISNFADCYEADIVRKRVLAMSRIRLSISEEEFRFKLP